MVSILIPIYNHPVSDLVIELKRQCDELNIVYEIIAVEDGSTTFLSENQNVHELTGVDYQVLTHNLGRASIRNYIAQLARHEILIFIDCDSLIVAPEYVKRYITSMKDADVVYGGTKYSEITDARYMLHHTYGTSREARDVHVRRTNPYQAFLTNNFCIRKSVFDGIRFDESLTQYGFEDSLFGWELKQRGIAISHIDNPVLHTGLDTADAFIQKTKLAVENAWVLIDSGKMPESEIRMAQVYTRLRKWGLITMVCKWISAFERQMIANLNGRQPRLVYLDLLKLKWSADARKVL